MKIKRFAVLRETPHVEVRVETTYDQRDGEYKTVVIDVDARGDVKLSPADWRAANAFIEEELAR